MFGILGISAVSEHLRALSNVLQLGFLLCYSGPAQTSTDTSNMEARSHESHFFIDPFICCHDIDYTTSNCIHYLRQN